jgi:predicted phage tail component-like protein
MVDLSKFKNGFTFNSVRKDYILTISKKRPYWAPIKRNYFSIPGVPGALLDSTETDVRVIPVEVNISAETADELRKVSEDFAAWLITEEPKELIFDDEPDRIYYAAVDGSFDSDEIVADGFGMIYFLCLDPYKYGPEESIEFVDSKSFPVEGSIETNPVIKIDVKQDTTFIAVSNGERLNIVGQPQEVDQQPVNREERKFWDDMGSFTGWTDTTAVEEGVITGTMKTSGYSFYTDAYGSDAGWHGPAKKISIGSSIQDFQVDALIHQSSTSGKAGSVEIALLDANNNFVAKMLMSKRSASSIANWARLRAGSAANGFDILNTRGANDFTWADFDGMLRISRVGNVWTAYVCLIDENGVQHTRAGETWVDSLGIATAAVSQIQVQLWQYGTTPATTQYIADLKVFKINSPGDNQIPILASAGDVIEFDHQSDIIRRNGEDISKHKQFVGEYFPLLPGMNTIVVEPVEAIENTKVIWQPKWR